MSRITFENYGNRAETPMSYVQMSGRYPVQAAAHRLMVRDVAEKLALGPDDNLLEIGCGTGNLLIPLSFLIASADGIDHTKVLAVLRRRFDDPAISLIPGNFLDLQLERSYAKILVYSVLSCLSDEQEVLRFVDKAADHLAPGGRLLLGDLPNRDRKARFMASAAGQAFFATWRQAHNDTPMVPEDGVVAPDPDQTTFDDAMVLRLLKHVRSRGLESYLLPQPADLPFGRTREDVLIIRPEL